MPITWQKKFHILLVLVVVVAVAAASGLSEPRKFWQIFDKKRRTMFGEPQKFFFEQKRDDDDVVLSKEQKLFTFSVWVEFVKQEIIMPYLLAYLLERLKL